MVKNPNWSEANQLAITIHWAWSRIWTRDYCEQIQLTVRPGLELGASELQVQPSNRSATLSSPTCAETRNRVPGDSF